MYKLSTVLLLALALPGQQSDPNVTFKTTTKLVILDVGVRDHSGNPVDTLKKEDFKILENGKPQEIAVFEVQHITSSTSDAAAAPSGVSDSASGARPNAINIATPGKVQYRDKRLLVLFFDFSSMQPPEQIRAQDNALKFIKDQMTPADRVAIMTLGAGVQVVQDFTGDRDQLTKVIRGFRTGQASELSIEADTGDATSEYTGAAFVADETEFNLFNTDRKLIALETAVRLLSPLPEKKALIYFSSGIPKTGSENRSQLDATVNAAVRANVAFYPVDARGLVALTPGGDASKGAPKGTSLFTGAAITTQKTKFNDQQETLFTLAEDTGGKALLDSNDLSIGIQQAQEDLGAYYILGYYDANATPDGKYRKLQISVPKQYQAQLDYRPGYFAPREFSKQTSSDKERTLQEALLAGDPVTELPLAVEVNYFRLVKDRYFVPVAVKIPGSEIATARRGGVDTTEFDFIGQVFDTKGKQAGQVRDTIKVKLGEGSAAQLGAKALQYDTGFTLTPGKYRLKFLVRENQAGKMGTFETDFTVPSVNSQQEGLRLSSFVWSSQREPVAQAIGGADTQKLLANHPLVSGGQKLIPSITRAISRKQNLYLYFEVYDPVQQGSPKQPSVKATLSFYRKGLKAFESDPIQIHQLSPTREGTMPIQMQVALARLQPGRYTCQVNIIDEGAQKFDFVRTPVVILP